MRRTPAILLAAALVLGACDGGDGGEDSGGSGSDPPASETAPTDSDSAQPPTKAEMRSALLRLRDMPAGWSAADYDPESQDNLCPADVAGPLGLDMEPPSVGAQYLDDPVKGPSFSEAIQVVPEGRGPELIPVVDEALTACEGKVYSGRTAHVSELAFPNVGDESAAYTIALDGLPVHAVYVVSGDIAIIMSSYDFTGGDPVGLLKTYATQALDKAERVLG